MRRDRYSKDEDTLYSLLAKFRKPDEEDEPEDWPTEEDQEEALLDLAELTGEIVIDMARSLRLIAERMNSG